MRVAVFSDIHGNIEALTSILKDIKSKHADIIISLGDIIVFGPSSNECLSLINKKYYFYTFFKIIINILLKAHIFLIMMNIKQYLINIIIMIMLYMDILMKKE